MIETTIIPILKDNYTYLIKDKKTGIYGLVDPADAKFLISILENMILMPQQAPHE